jgi:beta-lactam-binding protein with PASTA domain
MEPQFMLLEITREAPNQPTGTVVSQTPPPGGRVKEPASIEVIVAK